MEKFIIHSGVAAPLYRANINTDVIIPIKRLVGTGRDGLGGYVFEPWRYHDDGSENSEFVLNQADYRNASILVAGENFGCGSSREGAVWALADFGFRCVIAPSFGGIFYGNCLQSGVLPVVLPEDRVIGLVAGLGESGDPTLRIDLEARLIIPAGAAPLPFEIDDARRMKLLEGLDDIGMTLRRGAEIIEFQNRDRKARPWIYG